VRTKQRDTLCMKISGWKEECQTWKEKFNKMKGKIDVREIMRLAEFSLCTAAGIAGYALFTQAYRTSGAVGGEAVFFAVFPYAAYKVLDFCIEIILEMVFWLKDNKNDIMLIMKTYRQLHLRRR